MIIYFDENLPVSMAEGLHTLQKPENVRNRTNFEIRSIRSVFGEGTKDEMWIPIAGQEQACVITQDFRIQTIRHQKTLYEEHKLGMFFFRPPSRKEGYTYWQMVEITVDKWRQILEIASTEERPFAYRFSKNILEKI